MDDTLVSFDMPVNYTVDVKGAKSVFVITICHEKCYFTVVLGCLADGTRLPSVVIFKRKMLPKGLKFLSGVIVHAHVKGWMDECGTLDCLEHTWNRQKGAVFKKPSLLVWDSFQVHLTDQVKEKYRSINTAITLTPGRLTLHSAKGNAYGILFVCQNRRNSHAEN